MKLFLVLAALASIALDAPAAGHFYLVPSPTHEQTFVFGSERHQQWLARGRDHHLALAAEFTNDPYVDRDNIRQYDDFVFEFPDIRLGSDGRTFFYDAPSGREIPVAERRVGFLGVREVSLIPGCALLVKSPHGYLSATLLIANERTDKPLSR